MRTYTFLAARVIACIFIFQSTIISQSDIAIGEWKSYPPYQKGVLVTQNDQKIIYATDLTVFTIDKEDNSKGFLTKNEGLSDIGISQLEYDQLHDQLLIAYTNGNIDVVKEDQVINLSDILVNSNIVGDRSIETIHISNDQNAYIGTAFGIVQLNLKELIFGFTVFTELRVYDIATVNDLIYLATEDGVYFTNLITNNNPADFGSWELLDQSYGMPVLYSSKLIASRGTDIYITTEDKLYKGDQQGFDEIYTIEDNYTPEFINTDQNVLMLGMRNPDFFSKILFFDTEDLHVESPPACVNRVRDALIDEQQRVWYGDDWDGIRMSNTIGGSCSSQFINSPYSYQASDIGIKNNRVFFASGGVSESFAWLSSRNGYYELNNHEWTNYNENNTPILQSSDFLNIKTLATHPTENKLSLGSFWAGLIEKDLDTQEYIHFNESNSALQTDEGDDLRIKITDLEYDKEGNLWIANFGAPKPLVVRTNEDTWHSFDISSNNRVADIAIDPNGYKWIVVIGNSGGLLVYDDNGTINDPTDDRQRFLNVGNSTISTNLVNCVASDLNGDVWLGTAEGPIVFECGANSFNTNGCEGSQRKVLQDNIPAFLLQTEDIRCIAIDGANRKWFGTRKGIFVQSADGETQVLRLDIKNSPLFDNNIIAMEYNGASGEMFIVTDKGIQSYKTDSTSPSLKHVESNIYAYPNPVQPGYSGPIAIRGLVEDARVKITDVNGKLVFETIANGGQAIWDGKDYLGADIASGVYLVFSSSRDNFRDPDAYVTKIMVIQ